MSQIVLEADRSLAEVQSNKRSKPRSFSQMARSYNRSGDRDAALNDAVRYAVYAYASQWLPFRTAFRVTLGVNEEKAGKMEQDIRDHFWRRARSSMYAAMGRPCYRSILALAVFAFAEMPTDNEDGGFQHLCCETLFSHFNYMASPTQRDTGKSLSEWTTVSSHRLESIAPVPDCTRLNESGEKPGHLRNPMFWLGVITDSTRSLLQQSPSIVLPGRSGDNKVWDLIRQRNVIFNQSFESLHGSPLPLPHDVTDIILQHALACKTMSYGIINQFCDALFHGKTEPVEVAAQRVLEECHRFHDTLDPLLSICARDYSMMRIGNQLNYSMSLQSSYP